jgi:2-methylcitrate dehydratase PrpD
LTKIGEDPILDLARNAVKISFEDLPEEIVHFQKRRFLDTIGTCIAGSHAAGVETIKEFVNDWGGKKESTILVHGGMFPCQNAAFVNAIMSRALDFCDAIPPGYHASSTDIPTALAVGEMMGSSGKEVITALTVGGDLAHRITRAGDYEYSTSHPYYGFDGNVVAPFAAATITGKLLSLNDQQMLNALGIALNQAAGTYQSNMDGALVVRVIQGFATSSGILSALFAKRGISGAKHVLLGPYGFYQLYTRGKYNLEHLTDQLGQKFYGPEYTCIKGYPSCGLTLAVTDAALELFSNYQIKAEEIKEVEVRVSDFAYKVTGKPFSIGLNPEVDAQFSIQYVTANALLRGSSRLEHFTVQNIKDPAVLSLLKKVHVILDGTLILDETDMRVRLKNDKVYSAHKQWGKGQPPNPLSEEEFEDKCWQCIEFSQLNLSAEHINKIIKTVKHLEEIEDIREFISLCVVN